MERKFLSVCGVRMYLDLNAFFGFVSYKIL